jgi:hypothetical protein
MEPEDSLPCSQEPSTGPYPTTIFTNLTLHYKEQLLIHVTFMANSALMISIFCPNSVTATCAQHATFTSMRVTESSPWHLVRSINLWLYSPLLELGRFFSLLILYKVGRTSWAVDKPVARPLPTRQHKHRINLDIHPCLMWDSNPRSQCLSGRRPFMA